MSPHRPVLLLLTRYPVHSETFLVRERAALRDAGLTFETVALWGGDHSEPATERVRHFPRWRLLLSPVLLLGWVLRRPDAIRAILRDAGKSRPPHLLNLLENLTGIAIGLVWAGPLARHPPRSMHACWASLPAATAWTINRLTGLPYSLGAHAYDIFEGGGDWLLGAKLRHAARVHTSTKQAREALLQRGADPITTQVIRRCYGLTGEEPADSPGGPREPAALLAVGRLVEKKGFDDFLRLAALLRDRGFPFQATIIGDGPKMPRLRKAADNLQLTGQVVLAGRLRFPEVREQMRRADLLVFTGRVARDGDRDGLPNVIVEALAEQLPVAATPVAGIPEIIRHNENGILLEGAPDNWATAIIDLLSDPARWSRLAHEGSATARRHFDPATNGAALRDLLLDAGDVLNQ